MNRNFQATKFFYPKSGFKFLKLSAKSFQKKFQTLNKSFLLPGLAISPGMKTRIRTGQYDFPSPEWSNVSGEAKNLIKGMLSVDPNKRLTIEEVIKNNWISQYTNVPQTPLHTNRILKEEEQQWLEVQEEMNRLVTFQNYFLASTIGVIEIFFVFSRSLASMRVDPGLLLKNPDNSNNALLNKRKEAKRVGNAGGESSMNLRTQF